MDSDLADSAILETVVPTDSDIDLQELFQSWDREFTAEASSIVPFIEQRQFLLLDELVTVHIVLRVPALEEDELKLYLSRLSVILEVHALGQVIRPAEGTQPPQVREVKELLSSEPVNILDDPLILATELQLEGDTESYQYIYLFWKTVIPIGRPKGRLQKLAVFFTPSATLKSVRPVPEPRGGDDYLPSLVPQSTNLLQAFTDDPVLGSVKPYLSASRLSKPILGISPLNDVSGPIKCGPRRLFRAAPAFLWRIRFVRVPNQAEKDAILALFDIEITQFAGCNISLETIEMQLTGGTSEPIGVELPIECQPGEQLTLIYKILPISNIEKVLETNSLSRVLTIILTSTVLVSENCLPTVKIKWKQALETPPSRPPSRSAPMSATIDRAPHIGHDALTMTGRLAEVDSTASAANGVSLNITAPEKVVVGEIFRWEVLVVNRSEKVQRIALLPIPKRRLGDIYPTIRRPGSSGSFGGKLDLAAPVIDDNVLYAIQKSSILEPSELVCLTPDVKIGPLGPEACYQAELLFLPLTEGALHLEALRLVDLSNQQSLDISQIPDIFAVKQ